jgi:hypothetical protein
MAVFVHRDEKCYKKRFPSGHSISSLLNYVCCISLDTST